MPHTETAIADILIVTVTPTESQAVLKAFKAATGKTANTVAVGDRVYRDLGIIKGAKVFMALSEMGAGGLGASQQAVQKAITALQPHAVIMVGIAFGVNEDKQKIGDVLVSKQLMLYDSQRIGVGEIVSRGDRAHSSTRLFNYLNNAHFDWELAKVRFGLVLTGEKLVDNLDYRESLKKLETEAIGGEMEGAGLYASCHDANVDWILVKAICDWADGDKEHDREQRQQLAANNAAAFVLFALQHAPLPRLTNTPNAGTQITTNITNSTVNGSVVTAGQITNSFNTTPHEQATKQSSSALLIWQERLEFLLVEQAKNSDPNRAFQLQKGIEEAQQKISQLGG